MSDKTNIIQLRSTEILHEDTGYNLGIFHFFPPLTSMHTHDFYEFFLIVSGKLNHKWKPDKERVMHEGDLVFIPCDVKHGFEKEGDNHCHMINLAFTKEEMQQYLDFLYVKREGSIFKKIAPIYIHLTLTAKEKMARQLQNLSSKDVNSVPHFRFIVSEIIWQIIYGNELKVRPDIPIWIAELCSKMRQKENFIEGIERMQFLSNKSNEHLSREFKKHMNITPSGFINDLRLDYACSLLMNTQEPIDTIAYNCGFASLSYFNRLFKLKFEMSPTLYRKEEGKGNRLTVSLP